MTYPARVSAVPPQLTWIDKGGYPVPMYARYLAYVDNLLVALVAAGGVTTPQRIAAVPSQVPLIDPIGYASQPFARWLAYVDAVLLPLAAKAVSLSFSVPSRGNFVPSQVTIIDPKTGKPTDNFAQYFLYLDMMLQALVAAGV